MTSFYSNLFDYINFCSVLQRSCEGLKP